MNITPSHIVLTSHAREQMNARGVSLATIIRALNNAPLVNADKAQQAKSPRYHAWLQLGTDSRCRVTLVVENGKAVIITALFRGALDNGK